MNFKVALVAASLLTGASASTVAITSAQPDERGPAWVNGGIGEAEQHALRQAAGNYSLGLTFASFSGAYLANVDVQVKNARSDAVHSRTSLDPILLVDLPAGQYIVEATYEGKTLTHVVNLGAEKSDAQRDIELADGAAGTDRPLMAGGRFPPSRLEHDHPARAAMSWCRVALRLTGT